MRILLIIPSYSGEVTGKHARVNDMVRYSEKSDSRVTFDIVPLVHETPESDGTRHNIHFQEGPKYRRLMSAIKNITYRRPESDIIHIVGFPPIAGISALFLSIGKPIIIGPNIAGKVPPHSQLDKEMYQVIEEEKHNLNCRWNIYGERFEKLKFQLIQSDVYPELRFISFSRFMNDLLTERGVNHEKITVLPSGVPQENFHPPEKPQAKISDEMQLLFVGKPTKLKGILTLVKAVDNLTNGGFHIQVKVVGEDSPPVWAENLPVIKNQFTFAGYEHRSRLIDHYHAADAYVIPSYYELESTTMIEALSCGVPCVATNEKSFREIGTLDTCVYFEKGSPTALAEAIKYLWDEYEEYSSNAHNKSSNYNISDTYSTMVGIYEDILTEVNG